MKKLAMMGDGKTEREKLQAVEARRRAMGSRGSQGGAEEAKDDGLMSPISEGGRARLRPAVADLRRCRGRGGLAAEVTRAPSLRSEGSRPASRAPVRGLAAAVAWAESITTKSGRRLPTASTTSPSRPETPVGKSNMDKPTSTWRSKLAPGLGLGDRLHDVADLRLEDAPPTRKRRCPGTTRQGAFLSIAAAAVLDADRERPS